MFLSYFVDHVETRLFLGYFVDHVETHLSLLTPLQNIINIIRLL